VRETDAIEVDAGRDAGSTGGIAVTVGHVEHAGVRLYVREVGAGQPLIVVHGGPDFDHRYLVPEIDGLANVCRVVAYDQRGRGRSRGPRAEDVTLASEIDDLDAIRRAITDGRVALLGHSWGGVLAMAYAATFPERVSKLVLLGTGPATHHDWVSLRDDMARHRSAEDRDAFRRIDTSAAYLDGETDADLAHYRVHFRIAVTDPDRHLPMLLPRLREGWSAEDVRRARRIEARLYEETTASPSFDLRQGLSALRAPTLVLHGSADFVPTRLVRPIHDAVRDSRMVVLDDCGHFSFMEQPARAVPCVAAFLIGR
jgi:proline iminopeptidase